MLQVDASAALLIEAIRGSPTARKNDASGFLSMPKQDAFFEEGGRRRSAPSGSNQRGGAGDSVILSSTNASSQEFARNRYLALRKTLSASKDDSAGAKNDGSHGGAAGKTYITGERSRVSIALEQSSRDSVSSFRRSSADGGIAALPVSAQEEALFRSMQRIVRKPVSPAAGSTSRDGLPSKAECKRSEMDIINRLSNQQRNSCKEPEFLGIMMKTRRPNSAGPQRPPRKGGKSESKHRDDSPDDNEGRGGGGKGAAKGKYSFIERQEAVERSRADRQALTAAKASYDALIDKKFCPKCKAKQSYDDVKEKRKKCNNCRVDYVTQIEWNKVKREFYNRQQKQIEDGERFRKKLAQEIEKEEMKGYKPVYDKEKGKIVMQAVDYSQQVHQKWNQAMEADFNGRMREVLAKKTMKVKQLEDELYGDVGKMSIKHRKSSRSGYTTLADGSIISLDSGSDDDSAAGLKAVTAFLQRYKDDLERREEMRARLQAEEERRRQRAFGVTTESKESIKHERPFR
jgi:hypothetical protein